MHAALPHLQHFQIILPPPLPSPPPFQVQVLPIAHHPFDPAWSVYHLGQMNIQCPSCHALHWQAETLAKSSRINPKSRMCCYQGKISLPSLHNLPQELRNLFDGQDSP